MIKLTIPGFGPLEISRVVTDYTGTHSFKGVVRRSVRTRLARLARLVEVHDPTYFQRSKTRDRELNHLTLGPGKIGSTEKSVQSDAVSQTRATEYFICAQHIEETRFSAAA